MADIRIIKENCVGCGQCLDSCPFGAIEIKDSIAFINEKCTLCGSCVDACNFDAIELIKEETVARDLGDYSGIWVYAETVDDGLKSVSLELLSEARKLADASGEKVISVLLGNGIKNECGNLIAHGADEVIYVDDKRLAVQNDLIYTDVFYGLAKKYKPNIILMGATSFGRSLAPRVCARLKTGLTADCTKLEMDVEKGLLRQTRPAFGGNLMATIICPNHRPQMATVRPKVFKPAEADALRNGTIIEEKIEIDIKRLVKLVSSINIGGENINIADYDVIVVAGRGIANPKGLELAEKVAKKLGGTVGVSRPVVDLGMMNYGRQVGQTGKTICPKLYIGCGVSGSIQHQAGMSSAETIVAVNIDPDAPIFDIAHYGIVADGVEFLETFLEEIA